ncbi:glutamate-rich WD repeat-containing protein 1-like [Rhopilema esculentum]|uniref:glutamate-rich WD repeat-containing protein 1-like n=1 Tax=Rhopilema esculentum TaxID=499914 RepID=UPI0031D8D9BA|eukprot:gene5020-128_t
MADDEERMDDEMLDADEERIDESGNEDSRKESEEKDSVYLPGDPIDENEELEFDKSAYEMYHEAQTGAPCLSFDVIKDQLGETRTEFPMALYLVTGTQAERAHSNSIMVVKMSDLSKIDQDESDSDDEIIEDEADGPAMRTASIRQIGACNRIRHSHIPNRHLVASWSDTGKVHIWDVAEQMNALDKPGAPKNQYFGDKVKPMFTFNGHQAEGFAIDWSKVNPSRLATGSCNRNIHLWQLRDDGNFHVDQRPYNAHEASVEDIQWSPNESNVFSSCSADKTIRVWDARAVGSKACMITCKAHDDDVNVISWNQNEPLIVSGGDDGAVKVWDLRQIQNDVPVATFKHHKAPITSVEWNSRDSSVFAASGSDDQLTLWDLAVERDDGDQAQGKLKDLPPQLLFIHMGQNDIKEVHWHPQLPGVVLSTAGNGFNVFKTISV